MRFAGFAAVVCLTMCILGAAGKTYADGGGCSRIGLSVGGVHILGLYYEYHFDERTAARAQVGYMLNAVSLNLSGVWYAKDSTHRPYIGLGFQKHFVGSHFDGANLICVPIGVDAELSDRNFLGLELLPAVSLSCIGKPKEKKTSLYEYIFPLPIVSYKYLLE